MSEFTGAILHADPKLPPGTYTVEIITEGGAAVVNGQPGFIVELPRPFSRGDEFISYRDVILAIGKAGGKVKFVE